MIFYPLTVKNLELVNFVSVVLKAFTNIPGIKGIKKEAWDIGRWNFLYSIKCCILVNLEKRGYTEHTNPVQLMPKLHGWLKDLCHHRVVSYSSHLRSVLIISLR